MRGIICIQFYWIIWSFYSFYFVTIRIFSDVKRILTISQRLFYFFNRTISSRFNVCPFSFAQFHPVTSTRRNSSNSALKPRRGQSSLFFAIDATNFTPSESNWKKSSRKRKNEWKKKSPHPSRRNYSDQPSSFSLLLFPATINDNRHELAISD